jgi:hypothetical protein
LPLVLAALGGAVVMLGLGAAVMCGLLGFGLGGRGDGSRASIRATPGVVTAMRDMAKLDATSFHIEKVVEARDDQSRLWGLLQTKDALLLVAVGDVIAGVDLGKLRDDDVRVYPSTHAVQVRLPAPEVTSSSLDERATHVVFRTTDLLADRNEQLEGDARRRAEEQMRAAAIDAGILERARASADRTLRALLRSLGYEQVDLVWADRAAHETAAASAPSPP